MRVPEQSSWNRIGETHAGFRNVDQQTLHLFS